MAVTGCSVIFVLVQVNGVGVLEVVREVSHQEQVLSQPGAAFFFFFWVSSSVGGSSRELRTGR